jgi:hypothetical protein|tara:strand:- start:5077 stop:5406 length:330 start_codon:yes stop_codon:yes gene_type:complete
MDAVVKLLTDLQNKPHADINTGKIYGCKKGSREWWHEKGHIKFNNLPSTSALIMWQGIAHLLWMISLTLSILNHWMLWIAFPMLSLFVAVDVFEEWWCNKYANYHLNKK